MILVTTKSAFKKSHRPLIKEGRPPLKDLVKHISVKRRENIIKLGKAAWHVKGDIGLPPPAMKNPYSTYDSKNPMSIRVPTIAQHDLGCLHCDWKGTSKCNHGGYVSENRFGYNICPERYTFLQSLCPEGKVYPTADEFWLSYWKRELRLLYLKDKGRAEEIEKELGKLEDEYGQGYMHKEKWQFLMKMLTDSRRQISDVLKTGIIASDKQVDRDTPKKFDVRGPQQLGLLDINKILSGDIIDTDAVIEGDSKKEINYKKEDED